MNTAFNCARSLAVGGLNNFFSYQQRAIRSPGFDMVPNAVSDTGLMIGNTLQNYIHLENDQFELALKIALPIILGFSAGYATCVSHEYCVTTWLQDFAISAVTHAVYIDIRNRRDMASYKKDLFIDVLFAVKMCASFALDKSRNSSLPFTAHCAHAILTTLAGRIVTHIADTYQWYKEDKHVRNATLRKVIFIVLIFPIQGLLETRLQYSWKVIGADFFVRFLATYALFSPASPIVQWAYESTPH
jgi:hypothetical protein